MEKFEISISREDEVFRFEVVEQEKESYEFEVYKDGIWYARLNPTKMNT